MRKTSAFVEFWDFRERIFIMLFVYLAVIIILLVIFFKIRKKIKAPKLNAISVFTGGVKCGKSAISLSIAIRNYKRRLLFYYIKCFFVRFLFFLKLKQPEKPLFYSNIPLNNVDYVLLSTDVLLRKRRFAYKSVVFIDECGIVADSQLIKDTDVNNQLLLFFKLFGHMSQGGLCIVNTQSMSDLHYSIKRCVSQYFYIHSFHKGLIFCWCRMREERFTDDTNTINVYNEDLTNSLKFYLFTRKIFKNYDCYTYSILTDGLQVDNTVKHSKNDSLKSKEVVSFRPVFRELRLPDLQGDFKNEKK